MDFSKVKLIVADIDGTMVGADRILSEKTFDVINRLHKAGIAFGMASGRDVVNVQPYNKKWGFDFEFDLYIGMNGAQVYDLQTNSHYSYNLLKKEDAQKAIDLMEPFGFSYGYFVEGIQIYAKMDEMALASIKRNKGEINVRVAKDLDEAIDIGVYKILYRVPPVRMQEVVDYVNARPLENIYGFRTKEDCFEFTDKKTNKAFAVNEYCKLHNLKEDEVICIGDTTNDNAMIEKYYGVCLCNGTNDTKALAQEITEYPADQSGMALWIEKNILPHFE